MRRDFARRWVESSDGLIPSSQVYGAEVFTVQLVVPLAPLNFTEIIAHLSIIAVRNVPQVIQVLANSCFTAKTQGEISIKIACVIYHF